MFSVIVSPKNSHDSFFAFFNFFFVSLRNTLYFTLFFPLVICSVLVIIIWTGHHQKSNKQSKKKKKINLKLLQWFDNFLNSSLLTLFCKTISAVKNTLACILHICILQPYIKGLYVTLMNLVFPVISICHMMLEIL